MRYIATIEGAEHEVEVEELSAETYAISFGTHRFEADLRRVGPASVSIILNNRSFDFDLVREGEEIVVASRLGATRVTLIDAARHALRARKGPREVSGRAEIKAAMPGRVVNVLVAIGDEVTANQGVIIVEAMKMENELKSPKAGKVVEVKIAAGQTVEKGELLLVIE
ncbi:MAG TPA: biotin/lipoyl-containing protein [Candidatus Binataceae bacterium]